MIQLEYLEQEAFDANVKVYDYYLGEENLKGFYIDGNVALNTSIESSTEKACVLAEELGHHYTTVGNILDQSKTENRKQERRARLWAYKRAFDLIDLVSAYKYGCRNRYELAEYLEVTEEFLQEALDTYREEYGLYTKVDCYVICFEPLGILEMYE